MLNKTNTVLCFLVGLLAFGSVAEAQRRDVFRGDSKVAIDGELGLFHRSDDPVSTTSTSPVFDASFRLSDHFELNGTLGFAHIVRASDEDDEGAFVVGNPFLGGSFVQGLALMTARVGFGITLPIAPDGADNGTAEIFAAATRGFWNLWLWFPDYLSFIVPASLEGGLGPIVWGVDGALGLMAYTGDSDESDTELAAQLAGTLGFSLGLIQFGGRLQFWWMPSSDDFFEDGDNAQVALEPYIRASVGLAYVTAKLTVNLDEPLGFAFDESKIWGLHLGAGIRL